VFISAKKNPPPENQGWLKHQFSLYDYPMAIAVNNSFIQLGSIHLA
jgi:hypothetical protein